MPSRSAEVAPVRAPAHDARPLYLLPSSRCIVDLDGPALVVRSGRYGRALYPLGRVSRVVSAASVDWKAQALCACLARGIPVVLLAADGSPVGYVQPATLARSSLHHLLAELVDRPDWQERHMNWLRAERMRVVQRWIWDRESDGRPVDEARRRDVVRQYVYAIERAVPLGRRTGVYRAALMALSCEKIHKAGLASSYPGCNGTELHLAADICDLLALSLELELQDALGDAIEQMAESVHVIETFSEALQHCVESILGRLHRHVLGLLGEWR